jgi:hypothetical protein
MPFTVLKKSNIQEDRIEVAGEFVDDQEARKFVEAELVEAELHGLGEDHEYLIEAPPTMLPALALVS